ncbi:hypothetical protein GCM10010249_60570 [Streptomyces roseolilacinus]|uniref:Uncharacterized protein n=1 Tax=Streptomyces roseolilacinus TaxID=66904 RepID=A0A918B645_9ACTN|nr:hypothetical protein GCM10010249_60570 [Streptomyces roseolilacinus]
MVSDSRAADDPKEGEGCLGFLMGAGDLADDEVGAGEAKVVERLASHKVLGAEFEWPSQELQGAFSTSGLPGDIAVVENPVEDRGGQHLVTEDLAPFAEDLVRCEDPRRRGGVEQVVDLRIRCRAVCP